MELEPIPREHIFDGSVPPDMLGQAGVMPKYTKLLPPQEHDELTLEEKAK